MSKDNKNERPKLIPGKEFSISNTGVIEVDLKTMIESKEFVNQLELLKTLNRKRKENNANNSNR